MPPENLMIIYPTILGDKTVPVFHFSHLSASFHGYFNQVRLAAYLYSVAVRIDYHALVVAIAGTPRPVDNRDPIVAETLRELIHKTLGAYRDREMGQAKPLNSRSQFHQRQ